MYSFTEFHNEDLQLCRLKIFYNIQIFVLPKHCGNVIIAIWYFVFLNMQVTRLFLFIKEEYGDKELPLKFLTSVSLLWTRLNTPQER